MGLLLIETGKSEGIRFEGDNEEFIFGQARFEIQVEIPDRQID